MPGVSREQIDRAKQINILDYVLANEPYNVKRIGNAYYLRDHDSFEISNGLWNWHSRGIGGKNVVDYLIKVRGLSFVDAVRHLSGSDNPCNYATPKAKPHSERKPFILPPRSNNNERAIAYLQNRGIAKPLILDCIKRGTIYESARHNNCVFVGRDDSGKARYASLRGLVGEYKRDVEGSDKKYGFVIPPISGASDTVAVFESAIDSLSHQSLYPSLNCWRLSLGCTALAALTNFLKRHDEVTNCIISTDNDKAGSIAAAKIAGIPELKVTRHLPLKGCKDWNDALMAVINETKPSLLGRLEAAKAAAAEMNSPVKKERVSAYISI